MAYWYVDPSIAAADESDSFDGGYGSGKLRDSWADVTWTAGDSYYGACGTTFVGALTVGASGTVAAPITVSCYGDESLGWPKVINTSGTGISSTARDWIRISKLHATGCSSHGTNLRGSNCVFEDIESDENGGSGLTFNLGASWSNTTYRRINCHDNADHAIGAAGNTGSIVISNVVFEDCVGVRSTGSGKHGLYMEFLSGATGSYLQNIVVKGRSSRYSENSGCGINVRNTVSAYPGSTSLYNVNVNVVGVETVDNGSAGISILGARGGQVVRNEVRRNGTQTTLGGIWTGRNIGLLVAFNEVHDNTTTGIDGAGIFDDQYNVDCVFRANHISGHRGHASQPYYSGYGIASYSADGSRIHGNVIRSNVHGIWISNPTATPLTDDVQITNNTLLGNTISGINYDYDLGNDKVNVRQNVVTGSLHGIYKPSGSNTMLESYNFCWGNGTDFSGIAAGTGSSNDDLTAYVRSDGSLIVAAAETVDELSDDNPLALAGQYIDGITLRTGRLRPGVCPVGAYGAILPGAARTA